MAIPGLSRQINFRTAVSLIAGSIIGAGIFSKPQDMADILQSPGLILLVWVLAGLISFTGALIYAELGALWPQTGGLYIYFKNLFGSFTAFLYGWAAFAVINTAAVAAIAVVCAQYAGYIIGLPKAAPATELSLCLHIPFIGDFYPLKDLSVKLLAVIFILLFTLLNYYSVKNGGRFQLFSTIIKVVAIGGLAAAIFISGDGSLQHFADSSPLTGWDLITGLIAAMTGAFYAYDGWVNITFMAGEIDRPQRNIPRSLAMGVFICMMVYLAINAAYIYAMPVRQIAGSPLVAVDAVSTVAGSFAGILIASLIVICTLGAINGNLMASARVTYAMARDKSFVPAMGKVHTRHHTPANALWLHAAWMIIYVITGTFDMLVDMFVFVTWLAYGLGAAGIFLLRKKGIQSPYRIPGYPVVPAVFILFCLFYLGSTLWHDVVGYASGRQPVIHSLLGILVILAGVPVYFFYKKRNRLLT